MKRYMVFAMWMLLVIAVVGTTAYAKDFVIELKNEKIDIPSANFYIEDVIDSREQKESIGIARTGLFNVSQPAELKGGLRDALLTYLQYSFPKAEGKIPIIVHVVNLWVEEKMEAFHEAAIAEAKLEFYVKENTTVGKIYTIEKAVEETSGIDVTKYHEQNIRRVLAECMESFSTCSWKKQDVVFTPQVSQQPTVTVNVPHREVENMRLYLGFAAPYQTIGGNFNGTRCLYDNSELLFIPSVSNALGYGIVCGIRREKKDRKVDYGWNFGYTRSIHDGNFGLGTKKVTYQSIQFEYKLYPKIDARNQLYISLGLNIPSIDVEDAAYAAGRTTAGTAHFSGWGYAIGGGYAYFLNTHFLLEVGVKYHAETYTKARGILGQDKTINGGLTADGFIPMAQISYVFN